MSGIDFDKVLTIVGDTGRYQTVMFLILCIPATLPVAFLTFSNVFTTATPDHWCRPSPHLTRLNLSDGDLKALTIPYRLRGDGERVFEKCFMYDLNETILAGLNFSDPMLGDASVGEMSGVHIHDSVLSYKKYEDGLVNGSDGVEDEWKTTIEDLIRRGVVPTVKCRHGWNYDRRQYDYTLVTELDLVCDDNWRPQTSMALFYVGSLFGNVIFGTIADRWGRRRAMLLMIVLEVLVSIATCFSRDFSTFTALRAVGGLFFPALYQIPFILGIEMMGPKHRTLAGMLICMFFAGAMSLLALLAYLLRDWFRLSIATSVPFLLLFSYYWIIPESPRWLVSRGRLDEAEEILQTMAKFNGHSVPKRLLRKMQEEISTKKPPTLLSTIPLGIKDASSPFNGHVAPCKGNLHMNCEDSAQVDETMVPLVALSQARQAKSQSEQYQKVSRLEFMDDTGGQILQVRLRGENGDLHPRPTTFPLAVKKETAPPGNAYNAFARNQNAAKDTNHTQDNNSEHNEVREERSGVELESDSEAKREGVQCVRTAPVQTTAGQVGQALEKATILDIFRYPNIRKKFFLLTFNWIANAVVYNGLSYNVTNLGVNDFLAFFISAAIEIPSYLMAWRLMDLWGRRWVLCLTMAIGGLGCLSCMFVPEELVWVMVGLAMLGKFGVAASFSVFYVFVGELFPTVLRSQAMGLASLLVSAGLLTFPYIISLAQYSKVLPLIILGVLSLSGSVASVFLPETLDTPMPQTLEDGENFGKDFKIFSRPKTTRKLKKTDNESAI